MAKPIIEINNIGKRYQIGGQRERYLSIRDELAKRLTSSRRKAALATKEFWALRNVSFTVNDGEAIGIIGRNGAGKSTLLKILAQITPPTEGEITMRGRVSSLLEVGTGFHPELTGRENIYLNGSILGMGRKEVSRKFDEIVQFAEVEKFLETPVKRYSSGMYVRLAFAVAAHLEPQILIVDEVLAVGDAEFQRKCLGKMGDVVNAGRAVLFVSHNMTAVQALCQRAAVMKGGTLLQVADVDTAISSYLASGVGEGGQFEVKPGSMISHVSMEADDDTGVIRMCGPAKLRLKFKSPQPLRGVRVGIGVYDDYGYRITSLASYYDPTFVQSGSVHSAELVCKIKELPLAEGEYYLTISIGDSGGDYERADTCYSFRVAPWDVFGTGASPNSTQGRVIFPGQSWTGVFDAEDVKALR